MNKLVKKQKGITLIALIITVIVMLILAAVAINLTIGDNGIFRKSDEGAQIYKNAANDEAKNLNNVETEMGNLMEQYYQGNKVKVSSRKTPHLDEGYVAIEILVDGASYRGTLEEYYQKILQILKTKTEKEKEQICWDLSVEMSKLTGAILPAETLEKFLQDAGASSLEEAFNQEGRTIPEELQELRM